MKRTLKPVHPPAGIEAEYRKRLLKEVRAMEKSVIYWLRAKYRANEDKIMDSATDNLLKELHKLLRQWTRNFNDLADTLPRRFVDQIRGYQARYLIQQTKPLRDAGMGFNLKFSYISQKERQVFNSIVAENVNLIKSIARESLTQVEGITMRAIQNGHDLSTLTEDLHEQFGVSERRAAMIARDQTAKATNGLSRQRLMDYGITRAVWMHTSAGKTYRESHVDMDGEEYDIERGCFDPDYGAPIQPGELVNCRCLCRPIIPAMGEEEHGDDRWDYEVPEPEKPPTELENEEPEMDLEVLNRLSNTNIDYRSVGNLDETLDTTEIIDRVGGGDLTKGSCSSSAFCYIGNRAGYDVVDFRGGSSQTWFSLMGNIRDIGKLPNVISFVERHTNDFIATRNLFSNIKIGKEYYIATGRHAAMIRKTQNGFEFLELQTNGRNGWKELDDYILKHRFGCQKSHTFNGRKFELDHILIDAETLEKSPEFKKILGYMNTAKTKQMKGVKGRAK